MAPGRHSDFISSMSGSDLQGWQDSGGTQEAINVSAGALTPGCCPVHWNRAVAMLAKPWVDWPKITAPDEFPLTLQEKYVCGEVAGRASGRRVHFSVLSPWARRQMERGIFCPLGSVTGRKGRAGVDSLEMVQALSFSLAFLTPPEICFSAHCKTNETKVSPTICKDAVLYFLPILLHFQ